MRSAKSSADAAKQELVDYKEKASRILQSKDKLIATLKDGATSHECIAAPLTPHRLQNMNVSSISVAGGTGGGAAGASDVSLSSAELEASRQETAMLKEELQQSRANCEHLRTELQVGDTFTQTKTVSCRTDESHLDER